MVRGLFGDIIPSAALSQYFDLHVVRVTSFMFCSTLLNETLIF